MMNIHGASVAPIDPSQLPWSQNGAAGPNWLIPLTIAFAVVTGALNLAGVTHLPWYLVVGPALLLALHVISFIRTRNAVHLAMSAYAHDQKLEALVQASREQVVRGHLSQERMGAVTQDRA